MPWPLYDGVRWPTQNSRYNQVVLSARDVRTSVIEEAAEADADKPDGEEFDGEAAESEEANGEEFDIPADAYGAAILAIVSDMPKVLGRIKGDLDDSRCNLFFGLGLLIVNLAMQFTLILFINYYVVKGDILEVQRTYRDYRANCFDHNGEIDMDLWDDWPGKEDLCQIGMTNRMFYYSVLLCWTFSCANEIRKCDQLTTDIYNMPSCETAEEQMQASEDDSLFIIALTKSSKMLCILCVCIPKLAISLVLQWLGSEWLSATIKFENLVMNAVAMAFIVEVDEMLFETMLPLHVRKRVEDINFYAVMPTKTPEQEHAENQKAYRKSVAYLVAALLFVFLYAEFFQNVLPSNVRKVQPLCGPVLLEMSTPICDGWDLFFKGMPVEETCYPLGGIPHED